MSDEGVLQALLFDIRYQVALHTTSMEEQPMSDRTLSRFRQRCLSYKLETGIDLIHDTMCDLADKIADLVSADRSLMRMDSVMVESNIQKLSRLELIYKCTAKTVKESAKSVMIPEEYRHYLKSGDYNELFYHERPDESQILKEAKDISEIFSNEKTQVLKRALEEQTITCEDGIILREKEQLHSQILQSPYDEDATFRKKLHSTHIGYVGNFLECSAETMSVILDYQYEQNIYSDSRFLKDTVRKLKYPSGNSILVTDGGYSGHYNSELAQKNGIQLITTNLTGRKKPDYAEFRNTELFRKYSRYRNGVEAIPSLLRRKYGIDRMPVRGLLKTGFFFGFKIGAINVRRFCSTWQSLECAAKRVERKA